MTDTLDMDSLFDEISSGFKKESSTGGSSFYKDILKFEKDKDYIVRLLPNRKDAEHTIYPIEYHGWKSCSTGKYMEVVDPSRLDLPNPIKQYSYELGAKLKALKLDVTDPRMIRGRSIWTNGTWLLNCYVISDPTNPENEGKVKIIRAGSVLFNDVIHDHWKGERADEYGNRIFDPSSNGCNLKIRCTDKGGNSTSKMNVEYNKSYFMSASAIEGVSDSLEKMIETLDSCHDLTSVYPIKTEEELKEILNTHFIGGKDLTVLQDDEEGAPKGEAAPKMNDVSDMFNTAVPTPKVESTPKKDTSTPKKDTSTPTIDDLLADI
jgi:hypothetical protein